MNVFSDLHHSGLYYSLHLLFEERLGFNLYRPVGMDWFIEGWWDIAKPYNQNVATAQQFLLINELPDDGSPPLNTLLKSSSGYYKIQEYYHGYEQKAITLQQFIDMDIDIIIASIPDHWVTYTRLRDKYHPKAKVICQMGNIGWEKEELIRSGVVKNLLASTAQFNVPNSVNTVFYHQEQPLVDYMPSGKTLNISSYVHLLPKQEQYDRYKSCLTPFNYRAYGASARDGWMPSLSALYESMRESMYIYHVKPGGDGYGWNWHSAFMVGRPVLTNFSDYRDKLGAALFEDGVTGLDFEAHTEEENCQLIMKWTNNGHFIKMGENARKRFEEVVNYDNEEQKVRDFIEKLLP